MHTVGLVLSRITFHGYWDNLKSYVCLSDCDANLRNTLPQISLATLDGHIVDPENAVESEMCYELGVHGVRTKHVYDWIHQML